MKILYSTKFLREYKKVPYDVQDIAEEKEKVFRQNPFDPVLKTHKLHGELQGYLAFSVTYSYRIIFTFEDQETVRFYSIGNHDIYE